MGAGAAAQGGRSSCRSAGGPGGGAATACCALSWSGPDNHSADLDCVAEIAGDTPSGPVTVLIEAADGTHQGEAATKHTNKSNTLLQQPIDSIVKAALPAGETPQ